MESDAFEKVLNAEDFSTGGGSAAALAGAMAAALTAMVARLSLKKDFGLPQSDYHEIIVEAEKLSSQLLAGSVRDLEAFAMIKAAYALPKGTEEEKEKRSLMIEKGFKAAAGIPAENAGYSKQVLELANLLSGKSNPSAVSDLKVARDLARTALKGCLINIEINLPSIKDHETVQRLENRVSELRSTV